ncbi:MAG: hypothetical protein CL678_06485 [Bdellovibrionaceae bacterium]|nr:hypothetical protein [Pseudobdellovibrionaceae bacterium]|tara:strand:- start:125 stop:916 length:792 start_codon:yes stop_codon:yes gene_type:complete
MKRYLFLLLFPFTANAFFLLLSPSIKGWDKTDIPFQYNFSGCPQGQSGLVDLLNQAGTVWSHIPGVSLNFVTSGASVSTTVTQAWSAFQGNSDVTLVDPPVIICDTDFANTLTTIGSVLSVSNTLGVTYVNGVNGHINRGLILINADASTTAGNTVRSYATADLIELFVHEMGHALGLAHTNYDGSVMQDGGGQNLSIDDIDGIRYLYPREEDFTSQMFACGSLSISSPGGPSAPGGAFIFSLYGLCFLWFWRRNSKSLLNRS